MENKLKIDVSGQHPLTIVSLSGFLGTTEVYRLKATIDSVFHDLNKALILNLLELTYVDSAGIGTLLQIRNACKSHDAIFALVRPIHQQVQRVFDISAIGKILHIFDGLDKAKEYVASVQNDGPEAQSNISNRQSSEPTNLPISIDLRLTKIEERLSRIEKALHLL